MTPVFRSGIPFSALLIGLLATVLHLVLGAGSVLDEVRSSLWVSGLASLSALSLTFCGALHFAFAMTDADFTPAQRRLGYLWSVVPGLVAWIALIALPFSALTSLVILLVGLWLQFVRDRRMSVQAGLPNWYVPAQLVYSIAVSIALLAAGAAVVRY